MLKNDRRANCRCFSEAHEQGFETIQPGVRALNGGAFPVKLGVQVRVFGVLASAGTRVQGNSGFDAAPEIIVA